MKWAYAVTTVPQRRDRELVRTLASLTVAGFDKPSLFVDGEGDPESWREQFGLEVNARFPRVRTAGHWVLSLYELYVRVPKADRYAMFQDDLVSCKNLRVYLEGCDYPTVGYWNLYTHPLYQNKFHVKVGQPDKTGWIESDQRGIGAVALVFDRVTVRELLGSLTLIEQLQDRQQGWKAVDATVLKVLAKVSRKEHIHNPSLVQHTGIVSTMENSEHDISISFPGEEFDLLTLKN